MKVRTVDLNCDVGEGAGVEPELLPWVSSANVACGAHAGDDAIMADTMALARKLGVVAGAHPGFADREYFGRRELAMSAEEIGALVSGQLKALAAYGKFHYVKPHGALYNMAARDRVVADAVAQAVAAYDSTLALLGLAGGELLAAGEAAGLRVVSEVFADRGYDDDGRLLPRDAPGALIEDPAEVERRVWTMVAEGRVLSSGGQWVEIRAESVCVHGDGPHAVAFARRLREALDGGDLLVRSFVETGEEGA
ncbi:5-oxoprolinase subunit PxpA [Actomonas aquatica]|uniref:5-oxoprolinase subunit PxpA n=1 Tax=Actomonas aquatica TaxID=2866162 RepID=A0ABZ1CBN0_9BACT|nr:5-oxoprolinase subunit PxpA [Opitutus sp. WL0086]WRQ89082.1 5-oxoprolinase subunit PxpA [Opitutus sp. WL0086]